MKISLSVESVDSGALAGSQEKPWAIYNARADLAAPVAPGATVLLELTVPPDSFLYDVVVEVIAGGEVLRTPFTSTISTNSSVLFGLPAGADSFRMTYGAERSATGLAIKVDVVSISGRALRRARRVFHSLPGAMTTIAGLAQHGQAGEIVRRAWGRVLPFASPAFPIGIVQEPVGRENREPPSAVVFTHTLEREGAAISQFELVAALRRSAAVEPVVVAPSDGPLRRHYAEQGIKVITRRSLVADYPRPMQYSQRMADLCAFLKELQPNYLYVNTVRNFFAVEAGSALGIQTLWNLREPGPWHGGLDDLPPYMRARIALCYRAASRVVFVAEATRRDWRGLCDRNEVSVIPNALACVSALASDPDERVSLRRKLGIANNDVAVLSVGTVCARKGQEDVLRSVACLSSEAASVVKVFLVGDAEPEYAKKIVELTSRLPPERAERVVVRSATDDIADYYKAADIFLCSSRLESFPRVVLEAMSSSLSIITTPVCGIREQVRHGESALYYAPADIRSLTDILTRLVGDAGLRSRLGEGARQALKGLSDFDTMSSSYARLFKSLA